MDTYMAALAATLRAELAAAGRSVRDLATETGIPYGTLRRYVEGSRSIPTDALAAVATALGMKPSEMLAESEERLRRAAANGK